MVTWSSFLEKDPMLIKKFAESEAERWVRLEKDACKDFFEPLTRAELDMYGGWTCHNSDGTPYLVRVTDDPSLVRCIPQYWEWLMDELQKDVDIIRDKCQYRINDNKSISVFIFIN